MGTVEDYQERSRKLARRFLQTAVVVDDKAYMAPESGNGPRGEVVKPSRIPGVSDQNDQDLARHGSQHSLDAASVIDSFSQLGVICGVIRPTGSALEAMRKADIVVLDWFLRDDNPQYTLDLLVNLLAGESDRNSLRLVSIYTGEAQLEKVCADVLDKLREASLKPVQDNAGATISYQHGRVVLYAKSDVNLAKTFKDRSVVERDLPGKLVKDFAAMTSGLLPAIALTSLAAVREGAHRVLDRFSSDLDPAFLAHRMCLTNPDDAERQIVDNIAEEFRGLMDNAVAEASPAGVEAVKCWMRKYHQAKIPKFKEFMSNGKAHNLESDIELVSRGFYPCGRNNNMDDKDIDRQINRKHIEDLSKSLSDNGNNALGLDEQLAWIMSFRTVYNEPPPTLWLGSVLSKQSKSSDEGEHHWICMRPRCDCVRLKEKTSFFFLPLVKLEKLSKENMRKPEKKQKYNRDEQIVIRLSNNVFEHLSIKFDSADWICQQFQPSPEKEAVIAKKRDDGHFEFIDSNEKRYTWRGELKAEYAQQIAHKFAASLSRVAVDESEWLRRMSKKDGWVEKNCS